MKNIKQCILLLLLASNSLLAQTELLKNNGFEEKAVVNGLNYKGMIGQWQLSFAPGSCPEGCAAGQFKTVEEGVFEGKKALQIVIEKQTNRNDIKLIQVIANAEAAIYKLSVALKADKANTPVTVDLLKMAQASPTNGTPPFAIGFKVSTEWKVYTGSFDLTNWTEEERKNLRISIRPNSSVTTALPTGEYPKTVWVDAVSLKTGDTRQGAAPQTAPPSPTKPNAPSASPMLTAKEGNAADLKKIALQIAQERRKLSADAEFEEETAALTAEIFELTKSTPSVPVVPTQAIGFNPKPLHTTEDDNPFIKSLHKWAVDYLKKPFKSYAKAKKDAAVFPKASFNETRELGATLERLHWLLVSPLSNYRYNPVLFYRFLAIVYATSDDYELNGADKSAVPGSTNNALNDWFAAGPTLYGWRMAELSFGDYIPPTLKKNMHAAAQLMGENHAEWAKQIDKGTYVNRDISYVEVLLNAGLYLKNDSWVNFAKRIVDTVHQVCLYPDGAYSYIGHQNECTNYHGGNNNSLAKIWVVSGYAPALECLKKTAHFEPLSIEMGNMPEYYTSAAWKTMWNVTSGFSEEPLLAVTENPFLKTKMNEIRALTGYPPNPLSAVFYKADIVAKPLPNDYMVYDRNIQGIRARYGRFSYGFTARNVSPLPKDLGLQTYVGAMSLVAGEKREELDAALMAVHAKVHVEKRSRQEWQDWAYMSTKIDPSVCASLNASTLSSTGLLQMQRSGPYAVDTDWGSFQQWITLPDRLIGVVEVYPNGKALPAMEIDGRMRFTYGRTGTLRRKNMVIEKEGKEYSYGNFTTIIHEHNFKSVRIASAGVVRDDVKQAEEIIFRVGDSTMTNYPAATRHFFVVEIRYKDAKGAAKVEHIDKGNLKGLVVKLNGKTFAAFRNLNKMPQNFDTTLFLEKGTPTKLFFPRGDTEPTPPTPLSKNSVELPANGQVFIVSSREGNDLQQSWANYPQLLEKK